MSGLPICARKECEGVERRKARTTFPSRRLAAAGRALCAFGRVAFRRSTVVSLQGGTPQLSLRPELPGTWRWRPLAASACPSPASSSQTGHSASRSVPEASREQGYEPRPQAPPLPHVQRASAERPSLGRVVIGLYAGRNGVKGEKMPDNLNTGDEVCNNYSKPWLEV